MGERTIPCKMLHRQQRIIATKNQKLSRVAQSHLVLLPRILTEGGEADRTDDFPVVNTLEEGFICTYHLVSARGTSGKT